MDIDLTEIKHCVNVLNNGGVIIYPTDTIWGIGCDATNISAINKIFDIKGRDKSKSMLLLCSGINQISNYVKSIPTSATELIETTTSPISIIYPNAKNLPSVLLADDGSIGIRIPKHNFCLSLLSEFKKPLVSTSANFSGEPSPSSFYEISTKLIESVDYTVKSCRNTEPIYKSSKIVKISEANQITVIRE